VIADGDPSDEAPDVLLCLIGDDALCLQLAGGVPVIRLRTSIAAAGPEDETVYRYDRQALLDAMRRSVGGAGK
jgi:two-component system chemotaxis sensor kinase CheA